MAARRKLIWAALAIPTLLALAMAALWIRSHWRADCYESRSCGIYSRFGTFWIYIPDPRISAKVSESELGFHSEPADNATWLPFLIATSHLSWSAVAIEHWCDWTCSSTMTLVPHYVPTTLLAMPLIAYIGLRAFHVYRHRKSPKTLCPTCSYDLRAHSPGAICPECGTPIPAPSAKG
jgi:hypothetical protein